MNIVILTHKSSNIGPLHNSLQKENGVCSIANNLSELERVSRNTPLELLLVDQAFLYDNSNIHILIDCLKPHNIKIPIANFDCVNFQIQIIKSENKNTEVENILENTQKRIIDFKSHNNKLLRPAEKKLYSFLKNSNETSISLDEMSMYLWGGTSKAHTKTLYSYIGRIKHILAEGQTEIEWIVKEKKGCYRISTEAYNADH